MNFENENITILILFGIPVTAAACTIFGFATVGFAWMFYNDILNILNQNLITWTPTWNLISISVGAITNIIMLIDYARR